MPGLSEKSKVKSDIDWRRNYAALLEYEKEHGHCNVGATESYKCILPGLGEGGSDLDYSGNLGSWLSAQRCMKKGTAGNTRLRADREELLQQLVDQGMYTYSLAPCVLVT